MLHGEPSFRNGALLHFVARRAAMELCVAEISGDESETGLACAGPHQLCGPMLGQLALPDPQRSTLSVTFGLKSAPSS